MVLKFLSEKLVCREGEEKPVKSCCQMLSQKKITNCSQVEETSFSFISVTDVVALLDTVNAFI